MVLSFLESATLELARRIMASVLPNDCVQSLEALSDGATNSTTLIRLEKSDGLFVLRRYLRGGAVCRKETTLLCSLHGLIPSPELVRSDPTGCEFSTPYLLYRYLPGLTFRQIRANGSPDDMADAARAVGRCLDAMQNHSSSRFTTCGLARHFNEHNLDSAVLRESIGAADLLLLQALREKWSSVLRTLAQTESLVHGDFNHRNIVLDRRSGQWEVAGILDWELAAIGSPLWDAARFTCYRKPDSALWESHFMDGFRANSRGKIPEQWEDLSCVMNTLSAAESLADNSIQERFVPELKRLVHLGLRGQRLG